MTRLAPFAVLALSLALAACKEHESPAQTAQDVAKAQEKGAAAVADARAEADAERARAQAELNEAAEKAQRELNAERADALRTVSDADYKLMLANGKADYDVQVQECDARPQNERASCRKLAEETYDLVKAEAQVGRDHVRTEAGRLDDH